MTPAPVRTDRLKAELSRLTRRLLEEVASAGHWTGELSSSALSTAVATIALGEIDRRSGSNRHAALVNAGLSWLARSANGDGGWGDTIRSKSNISTTALCWAAFGAARADDTFPEVVRAAEGRLAQFAGSIENLPDAIAERYGKDRTFSVPILITLALSGRLGPGGWRSIPPLPFELALFPRNWFGALRLPVVSYALPALISIGQVIHHYAPSRNPLARAVRDFARARTLRLLGELQPPNGGFLEATPLTAFVTMSLAAAGQHQHPVAIKGAEFLRTSMREDGSWPIDTNLATWVTTLAVKALAPQHDALEAGQKRQLARWLLDQQGKSVHPYTGAAAGGWAWTDLPGGVPDADDTAGALLALHCLHRSRGEEAMGEAAESPPPHPGGYGIEPGIIWLLNLQNSDGGIPTFCRGWGTLPFDRSAPELTAHALRAWTVWQAEVSPKLGTRIDSASRKALRFLERNQRADGSFIPLWFGNEHAPNEENAVYGTAQVLITLNELASLGLPISQRMRKRAAEFLWGTQHPRGGWGGDKNTPETLEETALALEALLGQGPSKRIERAVERLLEMIEAGDWSRPAPIGLYFARLWYYERLYPLIFSVGALGRLCSQQV